MNLNIRSHIARTEKVRFLDKILPEKMLRKVSFLGVKDQIG